MPVKARAAKDRRPSFSAEALALFAELERTPQGSRRFQEGSRELARLLDLVNEFWTGNHVNDRSPTPCHPPDYIAFRDWHTCRRVRQALLAAASPGKPAKANHGSHLSQ
jgi:hypothetical protein